MPFRGRLKGAFVALVLPFDSFGGGCKDKNLAVFFFAQRGVTALVTTGSAAGDEKLSLSRPGRTWGTDQERQAILAMVFGRTGITY